MSGELAQTVPQEEEVAYHEAGHAVAACLVQLRFSVASIQPDTESLGRVLFPIPDTFDPNNADARTIRQCKQHIFVSLAGPAAEYHVTGEERWDVHHYEFAAANNLIMYLVGNAEVLNSYSQFMWDYTRTTMRIPKHWILVHALAQALLEHQTLSSRAVRRCLREALSQQTGIPVDQLRVPRVHLL